MRFTASPKKGRQEEIVNVNRHLKWGPRLFATYDGRAGGAFVESQAGGQDVVEPGEKASDLRRRNQHVRP